MLKILVLMHILESSSTGINAGGICTIQQSTLLTVCAFCALFKCYTFWGKIELYMWITFCTFRCLEPLWLTSLSSQMQDLVTAVSVLRFRGTCLGTSQIYWHLDVATSRQCKTGSTFQTLEQSQCTWNVESCVPCFPHQHFIKTCFLGFQ